MFWSDVGRALQEHFLRPERLANAAIKLIYIVIIVAVAFLINLAARALARRLLRTGGGLSRERRTRTLFSMVYSFVGYTILFVAFVMILRVLGVDYSAILAGAGVVGLAVGFGAQTLVRDFISGFFLLAEDLVSVGDWIVVGDTSGAVEKVGLRATQIRSFDGTLNVIPNGELMRFGNRNRRFMRALVKVDLAYEHDAAKGIARAQGVADQWYKDNPDIALEAPVVQGILNFGESGVTIRVACKVKPMKHWEAEQALRLRLMQSFGESGMELPAPRRDVYIRAEGPARKPVAGRDS